VRWLSLLLVSSCAAKGLAEHTRTHVMVLAPHPDDETLMAGGVLSQAVQRGDRVTIVLVTNGDFTCRRNGAVRVRETVEAMAALGLDRMHIRALSYPDGALAQLGRTPVSVERMLPTGECVAGQTTTWAPLPELVDEHTRRTGRPAPFVADALVDDLASVLAELEPDDVYLPHGIDEHPDHAMTYVFFRRALDRVAGVPTRVHRSVIHMRDECWPAPTCETPLQDDSMPPLPGPLAEYRADERVVINRQKKLELLRHYSSQVNAGLESDWLASFARRDEVFFTETFARVQGHMVGIPGSGGRPVCADRGDFECAVAVASKLTEHNQWTARGFSKQSIRR
jgi:LmbE family N-acetylglucosaminyl deacetylase